MNTFMQKDMDDDRERALLPQQGLAYFGQEKFAQGCILLQVVESKFLRFKGVVSENMV